MQSEIKFNKCYVIRHAERFDFKYSLNWLMRYLFSSEDINFNNTPITRKGFIDACKLATYIYLSDYFVPDVIYCSPYLRCKQTAAAFKFIYGKFGYNVNIVINPLLSETTYDEIINNKISKRIENIYNKLMNSGKFKNIILITHANIVNDLSNIYNGNDVTNYFSRMYKAQSMDYLSTCIFDKNVIHKYF